MEDTYWFKQKPENPLFPELEWSRPENKLHAGKMAIFGGNSFGFSSVAESYSAAVKAGIGTVRVLLPDAVKKVVGPVISDGEFAPSNPSGSFSQKALAEFLDMAEWSDGVLISGDLGRNSETAILIEKLLTKYSGPLFLTRDAVDYFLQVAANNIKRIDTTLVLTMAQLQKLGLKLHYTKAFTFSLDLVQLCAILHEFTDKYQGLTLITKHHDQLIVARNGLISTTKTHSETDVWRVKTAATTCVWTIQHPAKCFEAATAAIYQLTV